MTTSERRLGWGSGGWVLLLAAALVIAAAVWRVLPLLGERGHAIGDGHDVASYRFDLSGALLDTRRIVASGLPREGIPSLDAPPVMPAGEVAALNDAHRGKYLVSSDLVLGVVQGGEARAYPIRVLNWHEVVNDRLGGVPIAVTYSPLCDSAVVFDRRVSGEELDFGVSGLLFNSNLLVYDRRDAVGTESLWSQLQARAVAGPAAAAGQRLNVLPASLARWSHWVERHPDTTVLRPDPVRLPRYQRNPYGSYWVRGKLRFPVQPLPPEDAIPTFSPVLVLEREGRRSVLPLPEETGGVAATSEVLGVIIEMQASDPPLSVLIPDVPGLGTYYTRWFAWYALHPDERPGDIPG